MDVGVHVGPAPPLGAGEQAAVLVGADGPDGGAAEVREVLDAVRGLVRAGVGARAGAHAAPARAAGDRFRYSTARLSEPSRDGW